MAMSNPYSQYKQNSIMTASPQELNIMLYKGAMKFIKQSIIAIDKKEIEVAHKSNIRAQDIFIHFMSIVDTNYEVGKNLYSLYDYMQDRLQEGNIKKDIEILQEVYDMTNELKETWEEAMQITKKNKVNI
ncbi:flagellar export chaperone FliS [Sporosalibacterium faouarense]|uniref:flagellar export chaperone FliS n=1 Tax=Sporosalibacterium faouarense TaxID=516123 RepID=UPI00141C129B|nr:flagellar export chaperone FliS [Sporosalibacterium faouarense]MTI46788.1 flagellar export chaperone FliS [Bacillota bacterium]